mgnify:FL=1
MKLNVVNHSTAEGLRVFVGSRSNPYTTIGPSRDMDIEVPFEKPRIQVYSQRLVITEAPESKQKFRS